MSCFFRGDGHSPRPPLKHRSIHAPCRRRAGLGSLPPPLLANTTGSCFSKSRALASLPSCCPRSVSPATLSRRQHRLWAPRHLARPCTAPTALGLSEPAPLHRRGPACTGREPRQRPPCSGFAATPSTHVLFPPRTCAQPSPLPLLLPARLDQHPPPHPLSLSPLRPQPCRSPRSTPARSTPLKTQIRLCRGLITRASGFPAHPESDPSSAPQPQAQCDPRPTCLILTGSRHAVTRVFGCCSPPQGLCTCSLRLECCSRTLPRTEVFLLIRL